MPFHTSPVRLLETCFKTRDSPIQLMKDPITHLVENIYDILGETIDQILALREFSKYNQLSRHTYLTIKDGLFTTNRDITLSRSIELLKCEQSYIWTESDDFKRTRLRANCEIVIGMREIFNSYYNSIVQNIAHTIPKIIMHFLVESSEENLLSYLIETLVNEKSLPLLTEESDIAQEREKYISIGDKIREIKKNL